MPAPQLSRSVALVGVDESDRIGRVPDRSALQLGAEAARNALVDAGVRISEVDAVFTRGNGLYGANQMCEFLGIRPRFMDSSQAGGASFVIDIQHAMAAVAAGLFEVALIVNGENGYSRRNIPGEPDPYSEVSFVSPVGQFFTPFGLGAAPGSYAMAAARHMARYGTTSEQLATVAVSTRAWAAMNPKALMRTPLTVDDVMTSPWIAYPFHRLDCCLVTDAGGAVVVTTPGRARSLRKKPVWALGAGSSTTHDEILSMPDYTVTPAKYSGTEAFAMAGVSHDDIDVLQLYDSFTYTVLVTLESLGFCAAGEGGSFVADGRLGPGGSQPTNTNGGGLSYTHPGAYGIFTLIEAVRQLRGEAGDRQVPDARVALCNGSGGTLSSQGTAILAVD